MKNALQCLCEMLTNLYICEGIMKIFKNLFLFILIAFILSCSMESELDTTDFSVSLNLQHLVQNKNNLQGRNATTEKSSLTLTLYNSQTFPKEQAIEEVLKNRLPVVSSVKVPVSSSEPTKVSFLKIPVGINAIIVAECTIFDNTGAEICYTGTSDIFEVQRGRNSVEIDLQKITNVGSVQFNPESGVVDYGTNVTLSCDTIGAQILYKFDGADEWTEVDASSVTITIEKDVTISAQAKVGHMKSDPEEAEYIVKYKVQFEENDGDPIEDTTVTSENSVPLDDYEPIKEGYNFKGWYSDSNFADGTQKSEVFSSDAKDGVIKLYAKWEAIKYTVVFNANGGDKLPDEKRQNLTYDNFEKLAANEFTREGYAFNGWNKKADGSGTSYADEQEVKNLASIQDAVVTLYAQWKKIDSTIEIIFAENYSDKGQISESNGIITITIPNDYSVVEWQKDGVTIEGSAGVERITVSEWDGGIYTVTVIFKDNDGILYSKEMQVTINKVNN